MYAALFNQSELDFFAGKVDPEQTHMTLGIILERHEGRHRLSQGGAGRGALVGGAITGHAGRYREIE
jgi:hypothetical protein